MARLTKVEKLALLSGRQDAPHAPPPLPPQLTPRQFLDFATFASRFVRLKPTRPLTGEKWRL